MFHLFLLEPIRIKREVTYWSVLHLSLLRLLTQLLELYILHIANSIPVFCQSLGVHLSHFPTNYVPYNQYISPVFIPPPTRHPFLSNTMFPQPPSAGAIYLVPHCMKRRSPTTCEIPSSFIQAWTGSRCLLPGAEPGPFYGVT